MSIKTMAALDALNRTFLSQYPQDAARTLETLSSKEVASILISQSVDVISAVWQHLSPGLSERILLYFPSEIVKAILSTLEPGDCAALLSRLENNKQQKFLGLLEGGMASDVKELLAYPADSAGSVMDPHTTAFNAQMTVEQALMQLHYQKIKDLQYLFLLDDTKRLIGQVPVQRLALADGDEVLSSLVMPLQACVNALDPRSEVIDKLENLKIDLVPVIDGSEKLVGVIHGSDLLDSLKDTLATEMLTMVGASKDERALSSSWFAVKKRLPWLIINLFTAFFAAAVVGMFESTIAKYTALAVLLPIAAGQSGNTGAQALAVTMRGLTVREITIRHWLKVLYKEAIAALVNGIAIAITCGIGVYFWSRSVGLALIIALAMIVSMLIAAVSGALVPISLKKLGQDPALSSSIILTTITDIAGFMSFLGIATMLSGMLVGLK